MTTDDRQTSAPRSRWAHPVSVTGLYALLAIALSWPLASVIDRRIAGDAGDTLFNAWVLHWTSGQVVRGLTGDLAAIANYWNGNIFYPSPLSLAFSEHLTPQMLQTLPVFAATGNIILCYNLVWFGTVILSGLGMYLFVRELTGRPLAAFLAGVLFAFAPYRIDQYAHIEVLSSQWMPFTLYAFRRYFDTGRRWALAGGAVALLANGFSCGYYLAYFTPFAVAYCLYELWSRGRLRDLRAWRDLVVAGALTLAVVAAFLWPYAIVRKTDDIGIRQLREVRLFSADTYSYATAAGTSWLWGERIRAFPKIQGHGFPGFAGLAFALLAVAAGLRAVRWDLRLASWRRVAVPVLAAAVALQLGLVVRLLVYGPADFDVLGLVVRQQTLNGVLAPLAMTAIALIAAWPRLRRGLADGLGRPTVFYALLLVAAVWMSFGPTVQVQGAAVGPGLYRLFFLYVPGFNGLRVASMFFMLAACFLSVLAGYGAARIAGSRAGQVVIALGMLLALAEGRMTAIETTLPPSPPIYRAVQMLPRDCVLVEFPYADMYANIQYTYAAGFHRKPIVNGYSGYFPLPYRVFKAVLEDQDAFEDRWPALLRTGATYALVHDGAFEDPTDGPVFSEWLRSHGAREISTQGGDHLFALPKGQHPHGQ